MKGSTPGRSNLEEGNLVMANPKHLKILKKGVEAWNEWRYENKHIKPDLRGADLRGMHLKDVNLCDANLSGVDFSGASLRGALLDNAYLIKVNLHGADCTGTHLFGADLSGAHLMAADLTWADLREANLSKARVTYASLKGVILQKANLNDAYLSYSNLVKSRLTEAVLTGAKLYGTARDSWKIKDVKCKYVYWDEEGKQRSPRDRDFEPGEFERLYAALPFFEYVFEHGMSPLDPLVMTVIVETLRERRPEWDIRIDSINARGLAPSIRFTVLHEQHKETARKKVLKEYKIKIKLLKAERDLYWEAITRALDKPREIKLIAAGRDATVAMDSATINIEQHIHNVLDLQRAIADEPEKSKSFAKIAKKTALDIIGEAIKDIAKGQVKEAAKQIIELGKDLGPIIIKTAAYGFFKSTL